ncbi:hypothetical protein DQ04_00711110 [Trypanosoma grayi]|uniref:hypothetical protein n=1 Tax=Trypanosoma grayi TaxID=71804 RepID=UPI0004F4138F|nr:hypothetical protein DQ04_00711110 [Trypanosoma grayi]KEG13933.1 hypothetical protein DQ04_00711110 [Trypanosoma grayi]
MERLQAVCAKCIPDSVRIVEDVLRCCESREEELFRQLVLRYGPEPGEVDVQLNRYATTLTPEEICERLVQFYRRY